VACGVEFPSNFHRAAPGTRENVSPATLNVEWSLREREKVPHKKGKRSRNHNLYMEASQTIKCKSGTRKKGFQHPCGGIKYCYLNILPRDPLNSRGSLFGEEERVEANTRQDERRKSCISIIRRIIYCSMLCARARQRRIFSGARSSKNRNIK
jgi:hypothetical protein